MINPIIYAEPSLTFSTFEGLDQVLASLELPVEEVPRPALFLAGKAFVKHRREGGSEHNVPGDFFIGAHAAVNGWPVLTRDPRRSRHPFPAVTVASPGT